MTDHGSTALLRSLCSAGTWNIEGLRRDSFLNFTVPQVPAFASWHHPSPDQALTPSTECVYEQVAFQALGFTFVPVDFVPLGRAQVPAGFTELGQ